MTEIIKGCCSYTPEIFTTQQSDEIFHELLTTINWKQEQFTISGKAVNFPRLTAWYGEPGAKYFYSGIMNVPELWTTTLSMLREKLSDVTGMSFNSVLLNQYRDKNDSVSFHSDSEPVLGKNPVIASLSFGATRTFTLKNKIDKSIVTIPLEHGSLTLMYGACQDEYHHAILKSKDDVKTRINLTFRSVIIK